MAIPVDFTLYLITDRLLTGTSPLLETVEEALAGGVKAVQLREKELTSRELYELAFEMKKLTSRYGAKLLINDRIDIALAVAADGVHLGSNSIPIYRARKLLGKNRLIGVSCHNQVNAITAQEKGADFITFGPVFYTASKAKYGKPVGIDKLESVSHLLTIPVFAIGGVNAANTREVLATGATGIALISAIIAAREPRQAAQTLLSLLPATAVTP